ncbi:MAG TPA: alanine--tRNA ligase [Thermodesulfobacteriota bacterium]|nr:alanine--tRNA ligase [Thermodesulfobacteriota bacterium]
MKKLTGNEIREAFLNYFKGKGHTIVSSSPLIPANDPTLLFTNAGMNQFKGIFLGEEKRDYKRATTSQKCVRAGGKHNDLENVGRTARHHTFFEMLGNFSFGDYFKRDAISFAWEFLTVEMSLPKDRLHVTVFREDDEAEALWLQATGIPKERISRLDEKDNFWQMGDTGPCGPCSEILVDQGADIGCGSPECKVGCDCDRFLEIWNLVFMQYNRDASGKLTPLPKPSIDTGMGLERITAVVQGVKSNYESDLFQGLLSDISRIAGKSYGSNPDSDVSMRVIADHGRAVTFLIGDGVIPSNEGRGYVLRRIMRRAARHGKLLGLDKPFLYSVSRLVTDQMSGAYPELSSQRDYIAKVVKNEEERFTETLDNGLRLLEEEVTRLKEKGERVITGDVIFKLYDTYGFPVDLTEDILKGKNITLDMEGFEREMASQRERAKASWKGDTEDRARDIYRSIASHIGGVSFLCYDHLSARSKVVKVIKDGETVETAFQGDSVEVITEETPFYGESGGQLGDRGVIKTDSLVVDIEDTVRPLPNIIVHKGKIAKGEIREGEIVHLVVDKEHRSATALNHTSTHLLHAALREVLGSHVKQAGSQVSGDRLRFDFSHFSGMTDEEMRRVEALVNEKVRENLPVETTVMSPNEAAKEGAMALFGEKYGDLVRVVSVGEFSKELCGGTHTGRSGDIGIFKIISEGGVAAGIRRIEAVTGEAAYKHLLSLQDYIQEASSILKTRPDNLLDRISKMLQREKELEKTVSSLQGKLAGGEIEALLNSVKEIKGVKVLSARVDVSDPKGMKDMADMLKERLISGIIVLGSSDGSKSTLTAAVSGDLTKNYHAGNIVKELAKIVGGGGGGRPDMAQAGGPDISKLDEALNKVFEII